MNITETPQVTEAEIRLPDVEKKRAESMKRNIRNAIWDMDIATFPEERQAVSEITEIPMLANQEITLTQSSKPIEI